ncbi:unnamed protein product, partial [Mesorhabditis spiculigera]
MRVLVCIVALVAVGLASKDPIRADRLADTCDDCQTLVSRFVSASKSPERRARLQAGLTAACAFAPRYKTECRILVKNIERVVTKIEPYMKNHRSICRSLHLCDSNSEISAFAKLFMLAAKQQLDLVEAAEKNTLCAECQKASKGVSQMITTGRYAKRALTLTQNLLCANVGPRRELCESTSAELIPAFFNDAEDLFADSNKACQSMGLCPAESTAVRRTSEAEIGAVLRNFWANGPKTQQGDQMDCFLCEVEKDIEIDGFGKANCTIAHQIRDIACPILPKDYLLGCHDFLDLYAPTVVVMTVDQMDAHDMCCSDGRCPNTTVSLTADMSHEQKMSQTCEMCRTTSTFARDAMLADGQLVENVVAGVENLVCQHAPEFFQEMCGRMAEKFVPRVLASALQLFSDPKGCEKRGLC